MTSLCGVVNGQHRNSTGESQGMPMQAVTSQVYTSTTRQE